MKPSDTPHPIDRIIRWAKPDCHEISLRQALPQTILLRGQFLCPQASEDRSAFRIYAVRHKFLIFDFLKSVVTWDIQYSLPGEAPGSGSILRVRRFRFGRPIAISAAGNVPLASSTPANPSNSVAVSPLDAPIATTRHPIDALCRRVCASNVAMDDRLSITVRNRDPANPECDCGTLPATN